jgi:hypothetical protein
MNSIFSDIRLRLLPVPHAKQDEGYPAAQEFAAQYTFDRPIPNTFATTSETWDHHHYPAEYRIIIVH